LPIRHSASPFKCKEISIYAYQQREGSLAEPLYAVQTPNKMESRRKRTADSKTIAAERRRTAQTPSKLKPQP